MSNSPALQKPFTSEDFSSTAASRIVLGTELGRGNFSRVYKGQWDGDFAVAVKCQTITNEKDEHYLFNELSVLRMLDSDFCVHFIAAYKPEPGMYHIVTEYLGGGDLHRLFCLNQGIPLGWKFRVETALQVCRALSYLHFLKILHRDIKSENILFSFQGVAKICDFGFARRLDDSRQMTLCGTDEYMAPEICFGMPYNEKVDMFSFGILLLEMCLRTPATERLPRNGFELDWNVVDVKHVPSTLVLLIRSCAQGDVSQRLAASEAVEWLEYISLQLPVDSHPSPFAKSSLLKPPPVNKRKLVTENVVLPRIPSEKMVEFQLQIPEDWTPETIARSLPIPSPRQRNLSSASRPSSNGSSTSTINSPHQVLNDMLLTKHIHPKRPAKDPSKTWGPSLQPAPPPPPPTVRKINEIPKPRRTSSFSLFSCCHTSSLQHAPPPLPPPPPLTKTRIVRFGDSDVSASTTPNHWSSSKPLPNKRASTKSKSRPQVIRWDEDEKKKTPANKRKSRKPSAAASGDIPDWASNRSSQTTQLMGSTY